mmetsp:Transcript_128979/g.413123  ORF Transcript_128979/g.413123 Transcript_128979/m.413123 type:complete len:300 (-) Transcript_128979:798-1697(-)
MVHAPRLPCHLWHLAENRKQKATFTGAALADNHKQLAAPQLQVQRPNLEDLAVGAAACSIQQGGLQLGLLRGQLPRAVLGALLGSANPASARPPPSGLPHPKYGVRVRGRRSGRVRCPPLGRQEGIDPSIRRLEDQVALNPPRHRAEWPAQGIDQADHSDGLTRLQAFLVGDAVEGEGRQIDEHAGDLADPLVGLREVELPLGDAQLLRPRFQDAIPKGLQPRQHLQGADVGERLAAQGSPHVFAGQQPVPQHAIVREQKCREQLQENHHHEAGDECPLHPLVQEVGGSPNLRRPQPQP